MGKQIFCGAKTKGGEKCKNTVQKKENRCYSHRPIVDTILPPPTHIIDWRERAVAPLGQWIDVRSETRPEVVHHVYTGDSVNNPHCTCENLRWDTREVDVLFTCKHIDLVVFGKGGP